MINLSTTESSIIFTFTDSKHYLTGNGTIEVPKSSLTLVTDDSQMATFRKSASNDIFVSAPYSEFGKTKAELIEWFEENGFSDGGSGGVTPEDVEDMIDEAIAPIETEIAGKATKQELEDAERVTAEAFVEINEKLDDTYTKSEVDDAIEDAIGDIDLSNYVDVPTYNNKELAIAEALTDLNERMPDMDNYVTVDKYNLLKTQVAEQSLNKADVTYVDDAIDDVEQTIEDNELVTAQAFASINNRLGGLSFVALTQSEYDALTTKDANTIYFIK
jgi:hypothetical protein